MSSTSRFSRAGISLVLACWLWGLMGSMNRAEARYFAFAVGINVYRSPQYATRRYACVNDVRNFVRRLRRDPTRWRPYRINTLVDSAATEANIKRRLRARARLLRRGDTFVYYHSGHGKTAGFGGQRDTYLCAYDQEFTDRELGIELARFRSGVRIIVIIDAGYSAGMFKGRSPEEGTFARNVMKAFRQEKSKSGRAKSAGERDKLSSYMGFMTACDYDERSYATRTSSLYTGYFLQALGTRSADVLPRNGYISFYEAHRYARPRAYRRANRPAHQRAQHYNIRLLRRATMIRLEVDLDAPVAVGPAGDDTAARPLFEWRSVAEASSYELEIYSSSGRLVTRRTGITRTSWRPSSAMANGSYRWRVRAYRSGTTGPWSGRLDFTVSPAGNYQRRITLTWNQHPRDLDAHLVTPTGAHIYYRTRGNPSSPPYALLDVDDSNGYGPENITIYRYTSASGRTYKYYVHHLSGAGSLAGSRARVQVQSRYQTLRNYVCPSRGSGRYWYVFKMSARGGITSVNRMRTSAP